jgi:DNA-binding MarR family transcriptional regulator
MGALAKHLEAFHSQVLGAHGVTLPEYQVLSTLYVLGPAEGMSPTELNHLLRQTTAGMTKTPDRLEGRGQVERHAHPGDRRRLLVRLKPAGRQTARILCEAEAAAQKQVLGSLASRETQRLAEALRELTNALARAGYGRGAAKARRPSPVSSEPGRGVAAGRPTPSTSTRRRSTRRKGK